MALLGILAIVPAAIAVAAAQPVNIAVSGGRIGVFQQGARTTLSGRVDGRSVRLVLPAEEGITAGSLDAVQLVGSIPGRVLILSMDYLSRPQAPMAECGAGIETVLRVVALGVRPHETFHQLVASCWLSIEPGEITWAPASATMTVERSVFSEPAAHTRVTRHIRPDGTVDTLNVEPLP